MAAFFHNDQSIIFQTNYASAQLVELCAMLAVFQKFSDRINIYTDSRYLVHSIPFLETAGQLDKQSSAHSLFLEIQKLIQNREQPFFIGHIRAHSRLPGSLSSGNQLADFATKGIIDYYSVNLVTLSITQKVFIGCIMLMPTLFQKCFL